MQVSNWRGEEYIWWTFSFIRTLPHNGTFAWKNLISKINILTLKNSNVISILFQLVLLTKDDDECALGHHNCVKPLECRNTKGSFRCEKPRVTTTTTTTTTSTTTTTTKRPYVHTQYYHPQQPFTQSYSSRYNVWPQTTTPSPRHIEYDRQYGQCTHGFQRNSQGACSGKSNNVSHEKTFQTFNGFNDSILINMTDIDECLQYHPCERNQRCINTNGSYKCQNLLTCSGGYTSNNDGTQCIGTHLSLSTRLKFLP